jgi:hypothetical protein
VDTRASYRLSRCLLSLRIGGQLCCFGLAAHSKRRTSDHCSEQIPSTTNSTLVHNSHITLHSSLLVSMYTDQYGNKQTTFKEVFSPVKEKVFSNEPVRLSPGQTSVKMPRPSFRKRHAFLFWFAVICTFEQINPVSTADPPPLTIVGFLAICAAVGGYFISTGLKSEGREVHGDNAIDRRNVMLSGASSTPPRRRSRD